MKQKIICILTLFVILCSFVKNEDIMLYPVAGYPYQDMTGRHRSASHNKIHIMRKGNTLYLSGLPQNTNVTIVNQTGSTLFEGSFSGTAEIALPAEGQIIYISYNDKILYGYID